MILRSDAVDRVFRDRIHGLAARDPDLDCAKFVEIDLGEVGQTEQGYAKELTPEQVELQKEGQKKVIKYTKKEVDMAKNTFKKYKWPSIDVTRKSVEETAASVIKIYEIFKENA